MWKTITYIGLFGVGGGLVVEALTLDPGWQAVQVIGFLLALPYALFGED